MKIKSPINSMTTAFASITAQGQLTIPTAIRKKIGLKKSSKVLVDTEDNKIVIKPAGDILALEGIFHDYAIKGKSIDEIIELEENAWADAAAEKYRSYLKGK